MTLQQLEYILAVNQFRHFAKAAEYCRVTQPTLSAMIQKLEEELDTRIFDRSQQPVCPTPVGIHIIEQAQNILVQANRIKNIIEEEKHSITGTFKLGILPTVAPYLLPRFFPQLMKKRIFPFHIPVNPDVQHHLCHNPNAKCRKIILLICHKKNNRQIAYNI